MAISLTSDPIVSFSDVRDLLSEASETEATLLINAVSEKFKRYTHRRIINQGSVSEWAHGGLHKIYLHGSPVDESSEVTVEVYGTDGDVSATLTKGADDLRVVQTDTTAYIVLSDLHSSVHVEGHQTVKVTYTGGWSAVPGDITLAAIDQMRVERQRRKGTLGVESVSQDGQSVKFEISGLIKSVQDAFDPYRMVI
jgi:hypothetical protein